jgi:hypothetical protein
MKSSEIACNVAGRVGYNDSLSIEPTDIRGQLNLGHARGLSIGNAFSKATLVTRMAAT